MKLGQIWISFMFIIYVNAEEKKTQYEQIPGVGLSIVFVFGGLLFAGLLKVFSDFTKLPFNPLILISGIALGKYYQELGFIGKAVKLMSQLNPNGILAIFLPALVFESAFKMEWNMFKRQCGQTLILGIPSVILGSLLIMFIMKIIFNKGNVQYTWTEAFLLGSILSCTDIFSFVARLKKNGTPQKIISLIQGESLFNYCTCVLIFEIIHQIVVNYDNSSFLVLLQLFVEETIGGIVVGIFFGFLAVFCLKRIIHDGILVVTIIVIFCYSIYMLSQFTVIKISGIIAVVTYGLYMSVNAKNLLGGDTNLYVKTFWSYVVFVAEVNIFLISGVLVGVNVFVLQDLITSEQFLSLLILYFIILASRFVSIAAFMKWLKVLGYGMIWKQAFVIAYGGLKGAIGISFAMIVFQDEHYEIDMRHLLIFHVTGNSILTLLINGMSTQWLVYLLNLSTLTRVEYKLYQQFIISFLQNIQDKKEQLTGHQFLVMVDWNQVNSKVGIEEYQKLAKKLDQTIAIKSQNDGNKFQKRQLYKLEKVLKQYSNKFNPMNDLAEKQLAEDNTRFQMIVEVRKRFIKALIAKYWQYHHESHTSPAALMLLFQSAYFDLDTETQELQSWSWIKSQILYHIKFMAELTNISLLNQLVKSYLFRYISYCYDIVSSYIQANEQVRQNFKFTRGLIVQEQIIDLILMESSQNQKEAEIFLENYLQPSFPEIQREVKTRKASYSLLLFFKNLMNRFKNTGQLQSSEYEILANIIDKKSLNLSLQGPKWLSSPFIEILKNDNVFGILPENILHLISNELCQQRTFDANKIIMNQFQIAKYIYFVKKGSCKLQLANQNTVYKIQIKAGEIFGFQSLICNSYQSTVTTNTITAVIKMKKVCLQKIMQVFPQFEEFFWKKYIFLFYKMFMKKDQFCTQISQLSEKNFNEKIESLDFIKLKEGTHEIIKDIIFLKGNSIILQNNIETYCYSLMFKPGNQKYQIKVLKISYILSGQINFFFPDRQKLEPRLSQKLSLVTPKK